LTGPAPLLDIAGLGAGYGAAPVLFGIDATIGPGEIVALVGNNGAGKTTLLRAISRLIPATGRLAFDGHDLLPLRPEIVFSRGLVQVPEGRQLFGRMTVEENLLMGAHRRKDSAGVAPQDQAHVVLEMRGAQAHPLDGHWILGG